MSQGAPMSRGVEHAISPLGGEKPVGRQLAIAATFTIDPLIPLIETWIARLAESAYCKSASYNQLLHELHHPGGVLLSNEHGLNLIFLRVEDWLHDYVLDEQNVLARQQVQLTQDELSRCRLFLQQVWASYQKAFEFYNPQAGSRTRLFLCPSANSGFSAAQLAPVYAEMEAQIETHVLNNTAIQLVKVTALHEAYGIRSVFDPVRDELAHIPYVTSYFDFLAALASRCFSNISQKVLKVIVLDCDNTLWKGVCGEVGAAGVEITHAMGLFQQRLIELYRNGVLLALCSKNNIDDVWAVFENNKAMLLTREHIVDARINWSRKSESILELGQSLSLGLDSFLFIDDNPLECAEVRAQCPEVMTLQFPDSESRIRKFVHNTWIFDRVSVSEEDARRTDMYKANIARSDLRMKSSSYADFLQGLDIQTDIVPLQSSDIQRVAQLTQRTNQFNFTSKRRSSDELEVLLDKGYLGLVASTRDRLGSYGLVGALLLEKQGSALYLDTLMLSCRALGRGVEYAMLKAVADLAQQQGCTEVILGFIDSPKNAPAKQFLQKISVEYSGTLASGGEALIFDTDRLRTVRFDPGADNGTPLEQNSAEKGRADPSMVAVSTREQEAMLEKICFHWSDFERVTDAAPEVSIMPTTTPEGAVLEHIRRLFADHLGRAIDAVDVDAPIEEYARQSIDKVDLTARIIRSYPHAPNTLLFERATIRAIAQVLDADEGPGAGTNTELSPGRQGQGSRDGFEKTVEPGRGDIAVIGMHGRYPQADTLAEFWENLKNGHSSITEIPASRWDVGSFYDPQGATNKSYNKWGGFLDRVDRFETKHFRISPKEAMLMDPQQRLFLEVVWGLLEDAGYTPETMARDTGVFVGVIASDYAHHVNQASLVGESRFRAADIYQIPNRVSYFFDLHGPSLAIDTACSASATAVHLACEAIRSGDCKSAVVGGVNLFLHPSRFVQYAQMHFLSEDDACRPFGDGASGTVFGEGVGAVLLKPLVDAERDGDHIYGVIKATVVNSGGRTNGFTQPNPQAQASLVAAALAKADMDARTISYVEAHGTGTPLGDPIEIRGLSLAFEKNTKLAQSPGNGYCAIGSVKANIGHLESGAGIAGMIKVLLQMKHKSFVPSLHSSRTNVAIDFSRTPFRVQQTTAAWEKTVIEIDGAEHVFPRRAGVSSFGAGGSNAHIILEEFERLQPLQTVEAATPQLLLLSAKTEERLREQAEKMLGYLEGDEQGEVALADIALTLKVGRVVMPSRLAVLVSSKQAFCEVLRSYLSNTADDRLYVSVEGKRTPEFEMLLSGDSGKLILDQLVTHKEHRKLAFVWAAGFDPDWTLEPWGQSARRTPLPIMAFHGASYWLANELEPAGVALHPLLDRNTSTLGQQRFSKRLDGREFLLAEHIVNGKKVLPGVATLELARAAVAHSLSEGMVVGVKNATWLKPIVVENAEVDLEITLHPLKNGVRCETRIKGEPSAVPHHQCEVLYTSAFVANAAGTINLQEIKDRCHARLSKAQIYQLFETCGLNYGAAFRSIETISFNEHEALATVRLPVSVLQDSAAFVWHPSILDGALQSALIWQQDLLLKSGVAPVPFHQGELTYHQPLPEVCFVRVRRAEGLTNRLDTLRFDVTITDAQGGVCVQIKDQLFKLSKPLDSEVSLAAANELLFVKGDWIESELHVGREAVMAGPLVVLDQDATLYEAIEATGVSSRDAAAPMPVVLVTQGERFKETSPTRFEVGTNSLKDYQALLKRLTALYEFPVTFISNWASGAQADYGPPSEVQRSQCFYSQFNLAKAILLAKPKSRVRLVYLYRQSDELVGGGVSDPHRSAVAGLYKTIPLENQRLHCTSVAIDADAESLASRIVAEALVTDSDVEVRYARGRRYVKRYESFEPVLPLHASLLRPGDTVVITGGAGGLGLIIAEALLIDYKVKVVLVGRSEPSSAGNEKIEQLGRISPHIGYLRCDISKRDAVVELMRVIRAEYGALSGVIHAAGAIHDQYIINKNPDSIKRVLQPKVTGTELLDEATANEPLKFFALFSSNTAVLGNAGQGDYAYANRFMDDFVTLRERNRLDGKRQGKTLSINWSLWKDGGMQVDGATEALFSQLKGIEPISRESGVAAFFTGLAIPETNFMVSAGNHEKLKAFMGLGVVLSAHLGASADEPESSGAAVPLTNEQTIHAWLLDYLSGVLAIPAAEIDPDEDLMNYGLDSISAHEFANSINERFKLSDSDRPVTPALFYELDPASIAGILQWLMHKAVVNSAVLTCNIHTFDSGDTQMISPGEGAAAESVGQPGQVTVDVNLEAALIDVLTDLLDIPGADIHPADDLMELGVDSISAHEFATRINALFDLQDNDRQITPALFYELDPASVDTIANHLRSVGARERVSAAFA